MSDVLVLIGPGLAVDEALLGEIAEREFAALGVRGVITHVRDAADIRARTRTRRGMHAGADPVAALARTQDNGAAFAGQDGSVFAGAPGEENGAAFAGAPGQNDGDARSSAGDGDGLDRRDARVRATVIIPGPEEEIRRLMGEPLGLVVWLDVWRADGVEVAEGATHLHGRGLGGLAWAIRHAVHRLRHPYRRIPYGPHREQWADLYLPAETAQDPVGTVPVVALVHGGYWRSVWAADLMGALCTDLVERGFAVWNVEYRRPDLHGWDAATADVAAGLDALALAGAPLDLGRVAVVGHSAGGQLALRAAADGARVSLAVSLAGVLDLVEGDRRWLSSGAVAAALGTTAAHMPDITGYVTGGVAGEAARSVYGAASPMARLPLGVRQLIVQGSGDDPDLIDFGRRYAKAAHEAGDDVKYLEMVGDHLAVITPDTPIWQATALSITEAVR